MKALFLIGMSATLWSAQFIYDPKTQTVADAMNQRIWQDNEPSSETLLSYKSSIAYCEALGLAEHTDWRIPTKNEFISIIDPNRAPSIIPTFTHTATGCYWVKETKKGRGGWIDFSNALFKSNSNLEQRCYIRCIREIK